MGGTVVAGTDSPGLLYTYPGMALHRELEIFVEIVFTEIEALKAATVNVAKSINLDDIGVITEGYFADFIILNENLQLKGALLQYGVKLFSYLNNCFR